MSRQHWSLKRVVVVSLSVVVWLGAGLGVPTCTWALTGPYTASRRRDPAKATCRPKHSPLSRLPGTLYLVQDGTVYRVGPWRLHGRAQLARRCGRDPAAFTPDGQSLVLVRRDYAYSIQRKLERGWSAWLRKSKFPAPSDASRMAECAPDKVRSRSRGTRPRPGQSLSAAGAPARARGQQLRTRAAHASRGRGGPPRERPGRCSEPAKPRGPRQPHLRHAPDRRPPPVMRDLRQQSGSPHRGILSLQRRRGGTMEVGATTPGQLVLGLTDQVMAEGPEATRFFVDHAGRCDRPEPGLQLVHVDAKHSTQRTNLERSAQDCRSRERFTANRGAP